MSVIVVLVVLLLAATFLPWYRELSVSKAGRRAVVPIVIIVLLILIAWIFFIPVYWD